MLLCRFPFRCCHLAIRFEKVMQEMSSPYGSANNDITIWEISAWLLPSENNPFPTTWLLKRLSIFVAPGGLCCIKAGQVTGLKISPEQQCHCLLGLLGFASFFQHPLFLEIQGGEG